MTHVGENNKLYTDESDKEENYKYNFVDIPWDDRSKESKIGIVALLVAIITLTLVCVILNFKMQYDGYMRHAKEKRDSTNCHMVKVDDYKYIARILTIKNQKAICVGAVVGDTLVVTSEECVQSGPVIIRVGRSSEPRCRKNYAVDVIDNHQYTKNSSYKIVFLRTLEKVTECATVIPIGNTTKELPAYVIGRIMHGGKLLSRQEVSLENDTICPEGNSVIKNQPDVEKKVICVITKTSCPIIAGDLLVQRDKVLGISPSTTKLNYQYVEFSDITFVQNILIVEQ